MKFNNSKCSLCDNIFCKRAYMSKLTFFAITCSTAMNPKQNKHQNYRNNTAHSKQT